METLHSIGRSIMCCLMVGCVIIAAAAQQVVPRIAPPEVEQQAPPRPPVIEASTVEVSLSTPIGDLFSRIEHTIPKRVDASIIWTQRKGRGIKYEFRRDPARFSLSGNRLLMEFNGHYWVKSARGLNWPWPAYVISEWLTTKHCGQRKSPLHLTTRLETNFSLKTDWKLASNTNFGVSVPDTCEIALFEKDALSYVRDVFEPKVGEAARIVDFRLGSETDFRPLAELAWRTLQQPIEVGAPGQWLLFDTKAVHFSPVVGSEQSLKTTLTVVSEPKIITSTHDRPQATQEFLPTPQPPLSAMGFHVAQTYRVSSDDLTESLEEKIVGTRVQAGDKTVQITATVVSANSSTVIVKARVTGSLRGTVFLVTRLTPDDPVNNTPSYNLAFSEESTKTIDGMSAGWIKNTKLLREIGETLYAVIGEQINSTQDDLLKALNRPLNDRATLEISLPKHRLFSIFGSGGSVQLQIVHDGAAKLILK